MSQTAEERKTLLKSLKAGERVAFNMGSEGGPTGSALVTMVGAFGPIFKFDGGEPEKGLEIFNVKRINQ